MIMAGLVDSGTQNIPLGLGFLHLGVGFLSAAALPPNLPALGARGGTQSGKGYRLRSDRRGAVAVVTQDG